MADSIKCPHCGHSIEVAEVLRHQLEEEYKSKYSKELDAAKNLLEDSVRRELQEKTGKDFEELNKQLNEKQKKVEEMMEMEMKLREEKRKLLEKEKEMELTMQRKLDEERQKIEENVLKRASDEHRLKDLEKEKKLQDALKQIEIMKTKMQQGSQQLQGEVLELDLEETFRATFPDDEVEPVGKGVKGADIRQIVKSPRGYVCGIILWETKRTKAWSDGWCTKLKDDLRSEKANIPVIITAKLPDTVKNGFGFHNGVVVVGYEYVLPLATLLRKNLLDAGFERAKSAHKGEKSDYLYEYITSHEFKQQVEAMLEIYKDMQVQLAREKAAFEKIWKVREGQAQRLIKATANVVGSIQGRVGQSALPVKGLDLFELDSGN